MALRATVDQQHGRQIFGFHPLRQTQEGWQFQAVACLDLEALFCDHVFAVQARVPWRKKYHAVRALVPQIKLAWRLGVARIDDVTGLIIAHADNAVKAIGQGTVDKAHQFPLVLVPVGILGLVNLAATRQPHHLPCLARVDQATFHITVAVSQFERALQRWVAQVNAEQGAPPFMIGQQIQLVGVLAKPEWRQTVFAQRLVGPELAPVFSIGIASMDLDQGLVLIHTQAYLVTAIDHPGTEIVTRVEDVAARAAFHIQADNRRAEVERCLVSVAFRRVAQSQKHMFAIVWFEVQHLILILWLQLPLKTIGLHQVDDFAAIGLGRQQACLVSCHAADIAVPHDRSFTGKHGGYQQPVVANPAQPSEAVFAVVTGHDADALAGWSQVLHQNHAGPLVIHKHGNFLSVRGQGCPLDEGRRSERLDRQSRCCPNTCGAKQQHAADKPKQGLHICLPFYAAPVPAAYSLTFTGSV